MTDINEGKGLFDGATKDEAGVWHTNKFKQLYDDVKAVLDANPQSWLGHVGSVLLLQKLGVLHGTLEALLSACAVDPDQAAKLLPFFEAFVHYQLPQGYAVDAEAGNPLVVTKESDIHEDKRELVVVDLLALRDVVQKACDVLADQWAGKISSLPVAELLKSK